MKILSLIAAAALISTAASMRLGDAYAPDDPDLSVGDDDRHRGAGRALL